MRLIAEQLSVEEDLKARSSASGGSIELRGVTAGYGRTSVLSELDLDVRPGEFAYVVGPSGSGKSTFLKVLHGTIPITAGTAMLDGIPLHHLRKWQTAKVRRLVGCVFQSYELLSHLSVLNNVLLPLKLAHPEVRDPKAFSEDALELVRLEHKRDAYPAELSGGEQQRVAVARAVACQPKVLLADEPTGNLDAASSRDMMAIFEALNDLGSTIVMATHDERLVARYPHRMIQLQRERALADYFV